MTSVRPVAFAGGIFLSSSLLFLLEPVSAKRLLPLLGGSAAVWTTCLAFFQCALLVGYFLAHVLATRATFRVQATVYVSLLVLSLAQLGLAIRPVTSANVVHPISSVLWLLTLLIGLPFVTLSATSPLLQSWYARSIRASGESGQASNPGRVYRLFAVSNIGSLLALLAYPWLLEPRFNLRGQTLSIVAGFALLAAICMAMAASLRRLPASMFGPVRPVVPETEGFDRRDVPIADVVLWVALPACASILLSAVTSHITETVAPIPLFWIVPLVLYLLTFVLAFAGKRGSLVPRTWAAVLAVGGMLTMAILLFFADRIASIGGVIRLYCVSLFFVCLFCHTELYRRRPTGERLTTFYLAIAAGGALGAMLVAVVAPMALSGSYDLALGMCALAIVALVSTWDWGGVPRMGWTLLLLVVAIVVAGQVVEDNTLDILRVRNFYGTLHLKQDYDQGLQSFRRDLYHGIIRHGAQVFRTDLVDMPSTYFTHSSGAGHALDLCCDGRPRRVGIVGLGVGTLAAYGKRGDVFRFYELNPAVEPIARNFFRYVVDSRATIEIVPGDARVSLAAEPPQRYDVLVIDAFSGDAIPIHLLTAEALQLYERHLVPGGILAFHVSNYFLNLPPVVGQLARHAGMKAVLVSTDDNRRIDGQGADWVLATRNESFLSLPAIAAVARPIPEQPGLALWTDDFNSLVPVLRLR